MKTLKYIGAASRFSIIFCLPLISAYAQTKNFELNNPNAIPLNNESLEILTSGYWRVYKDVMESRESTISTPKNISMCYYPDGTFFYNGSVGTWEILENTYIEHKLDKEVKDYLNFRGIFSVTALNNFNGAPTTLTLTKLLTSSHDMKRTLYLKSSTILTKTEQPNSGSPFIYKGSLNESTIDSLSSMDSDELFNAGFTILPNNKIHIIASDTLYVIRLKATNNRYERIPFH